MLAGQGAGQLDNLGDLGFALMNPTRHELVRLMSRNEDVASSISELPGLRHIASTHYLELYASDSGRPRGLEAWRDSTVLLVTAVVERGRGWKQVDAVVAP